jgi:hypothetical protein
VGNLLQLIVFIVQFEFKKVSMKKLFIICLCLVPSMLSHSQATTDYDFILCKIERSYPGFKQKSRNGEFDMYKRYIKKQFSNDTFEILSRLIYFFEDQHFRLFDVSHFKKKIDSIQSKKNLLKINSYFSQKANRKLLKYEGYWLNDYKNCIIAIRKKIKKGIQQYEGILIEAKGSKLSPGTIIFEFEEVEKNKYLTSYIDPAGEFKTHIKSVFKNDSTMITHPYGKWKRMSSYSDSSLTKYEKYSFVATAQQLDDKNFLVTIPVNSGKNTLIIDSLIKVNKDFILRTENLIIDIRNNSGGSVRTYSPITPLVYTKPIRKVGGYYYCVDDVIKMKDDYIKRTKSRWDSARLQKEEQQLQSMKDNKGGEIFTDGEIVKHDTIFNYPKNVAIITNYGSMSAAEIMLLDFKQSNKVKLFGEPTQGAIDYLDAYTHETPVNKYFLFIPSIRRDTSYGPPLLDKTGIAPDVMIDDNVKDWVEFVKKYYDKN